MKNNPSILFVDDDPENFKAIRQSDGVRTVQAGKRLLWKNDRATLHAYALKLGPRLRRWALQSLFPDWAVDAHGGLRPSTMARIVRECCEPGATIKDVAFDWDGTLSLVQLPSKQRYEERKAMVESQSGCSLQDADMADLYFGGRARAQAIKEMFSMLTKAGIRIHIITVNDHAHLGVYVAKLVGTTTHVINCSCGADKAAQLIALNHHPTARQVVYIDHEDASATNAVVEFRGLPENAPKVSSLHVYGSAVSKWILEQYHIGCSYPKASGLSVREIDALAKEGHRLVVLGEKALFREYYKGPLEEIATTFNLSVAHVQTYLFGGIERLRAVRRCLWALGARCVILCMPDRLASVRAQLPAPPTVRILGLTFQKRPAEAARLAVATQ